MVTSTVTPKIGKETVVHANTINICKKTVTLEVGETKTLKITTVTINLKVLQNGQYVDKDVDVTLGFRNTPE